MLCKRNPTVLALISRRFIQTSLNQVFEKYDSWYHYGDYDYDRIFQLTQVVAVFTRLSSFIDVGG